MYPFLLPGVDYIMLNEKVPPLDDVRVRQALNYAVNRTELAQTLDNAVLPCYGYMSPTMLAYDNSTESYAANMYAYNPDKAKSLLTEAGWTMGPDGIFYKNGQPLSFTFLNTNDNPDLNRVGPLLQAQFAKVGAQVKIQEFTYSYIRDQTTRWNFQLAARFYVWHDPVGILPYLLDINEGGNFTYNNPQVNKLLEEDMNGALTPANRTALYTQVQDMLLNDEPWIPLFVEKQYDAVRNNVQGLIIMPPYASPLILNDVKIIAGTSQAIAPPLPLLLTMGLFVNFGCIATRKRSRVTS
jgi:peptide/nickel transport system substrate-binding protein